MEKKFPISVNHCASQRTSANSLALFVDPAVPDAGYLSTINALSSYENESHIRNYAQFIAIYAHTYDETLHVISSAP